MRPFLDYAQVARLIEGASELLGVVAQTLLAIEVLPILVGICVAVASGLIAQRVQESKSRVLPYLPSHSTALSHQHSTATRFFAAVHEMSMGLVEAWNAVNTRAQRGDPVEAAIKTEYVVPACEAVRSEGRALRQELRNYSDLQTASSLASNAISAAWSYKTRDNYRTETYTETYQDSDGDTQTRTGTREVYEDTDHWFTLDRDRLAVAKKALEELAQDFGSLKLPIPNVRQARVELKRIEDPQMHFLRRLVQDTVLEQPDAPVTDAKLAHLVNQWILGTELDHDLQTFHRGLDRLVERLPGALQTLDQSVNSYHFRTTSTDHSGPAGYGVAYALIGDINRAQRGWVRASGMITECDTAASTVLDWLEDSQNIETDREFMEQAIVAYEAAFPRSELEIDQLPAATWTWGVAIGSGLLASVVTFVMYAWATF